MYRFPWGPEWFGLAAARREEVIRSADLVINVSGTLEHPDRYRAAARLAYIDSDPVFTQVKLARGQGDFRRLIDMHDVHFSFGELIDRGAAPECRKRDIDGCRRASLSSSIEWAGPADPPRDAFTTIMNWTSYKPVEYEGRQYGQKDMEFSRFLDLPGLVTAPLEVAMSAGQGATAASTAPDPTRMERRRFQRRVP